MSETMEHLTWQPAMFYRAVPGGEPRKEDGYECRGMALRHSGWRTPRTETQWTLIHIGSGGTIARFTGNVATIFPVALEVALCSDWTLFDMPEGWRQTDPDLPAKIGAIFNANPQARPDTSFVGREISDADARAVVLAREGGDA